MNTESDWFPNAPEHCTAIQALRLEVREFIREEKLAGRIVPGQTWTTYSREFSLRCAEQGYIGMVWPKKYGGSERSAFERYVVMEELLAAGAPQGSHWIADRQSGPQIMRHGCDALKDRILPQITAGKCTFGIGMSEPDSGSDLASIRTRADKVEGGWIINGQKTWTTNGHHADYIIVLCRTEPQGENRYAGMSQIVLPLTTEGVTTRPIRNIAGDDEFSEVIMRDCFVSDEHLLDKPGTGWKLVNEELGFERSGPDRILSTFGLLSLMIDSLGGSDSRHVAVELGRLVARLVCIRSLSLEITHALSRGEPIGAKATMMKELGTTLEQEIPEVARKLLDIRPSYQRSGTAYALATAICNAPCFSLRGGTREILKGIIAKELGLR